MRTKTKLYLSFNKLEWPQCRCRPSETKTFFLWPSLRFSGQVRPHRKPKNAGLHWVFWLPYSSLSVFEVDLRPTQTRIIHRDSVQSCPLIDSIGFALNRIFRHTIFSWDPWELLNVANCRNCRVGKFTRAHVKLARKWTIRENVEENAKIIHRPALPPLKKFLWWKETKTKLVS